MSEPRRAPYPAPRYGVIDAARGFALINMVAYHLLYDLFAVYSLDPDFAFSTPAMIWSRGIGFAFIILSGVSVNFSRHGYRRGLIVLIGAAAITAATLIFVPSELIWFGVLHFLGCAILITFALRKALSKPDPRICAAASLVLFAMLYGMPRGYLGFFTARLIELPEALYASPYLAIIGLPSKGFHSADYYPLLPWIFLYFFGFFLWRIIRMKGLDKYLTRRIPVLDFIGRHSFVIYMLHQPVLFGILFLIFGHF